MATNINLIAPEKQGRAALSGKSSIILSIIIVLIALGAYGAISFLAGKYAAVDRTAQAGIQSERAEMNGPAYAAIADFQDRLNILDKAIGDHYQWNVFLQSFSRFVLPEVRLTSLTWSEKDGKLNVKGMAPNFDVLSREIILLQKLTGAGTVEFKQAGEGSTFSQTSQGGINFELNVKVNMDSLSGKS